MTNSMNCHSYRTIAMLATAYCCYVASSTATAFVTPSIGSSSPMFVATNKESSSRVRRNLLSSPQLPNLNYHHPRKVTRTAASETSSSSSETSSLLSLTQDDKAILSVGLWCALDIAFKRLFVGLGIAGKFPSSLAGCGVVLAALLAIPKASSKESRLHRSLSPGATLLAKWLPVFFVPSLVTLPLAGSIESLGGSTEILKTLAVLLGGFYFTLFTTAGSVLGVEKLMGTKDTASSTDSDVVEATVVESDEKTPAVAPPKPFSDTLMKRLRVTAVFSGLVALEGASPVFTSAPARLLVKYQTPLLSLLLGSTTLASFVYGSRMSKKIKKVVHPLVTCTTITWAVMGLFSKVVEKSFASMLTTYKMGKGIRGLAGTGAGDVLLFLLGPAVMSLAISMYDKRELIRDNFLQIATAISVSSLGGLFGTAWMVRLIGLVQPSFRVALLSRNITSPLAMAIAGLLGASASTVSIAVSIVVVTGLIGANFGAAILSAAGIKNPVARGMGIGAAAHGLGTAAFVDEKDAFPFSAISMALTATACTCLVSVPAIKKLVLSIALNGAV